jgi:hypothetical protein
MMGKRPGLVGAARSERDVVRWVSRQCPLGRRSWSIRVVGEEGDEVRMQVCQARGEGGAMWQARREGWEPFEWRYMRYVANAEPHGRTS